jgi:SAM-dependent methyltransferase
VDDVIRFSEPPIEQARRVAHGPGEYAEQESFMQASEIRSLAAHAGVGPGTSVLDLCCGIGGPGRFLTRELGCSYLGIDRSADAIAVARERGRGLDCRFEVAQVPPLPAGRFDVVLLLETMLAFADKAALVRQIADALPAGGRFAFTLEEGAPLTAEERVRMPHADTVWPTPLATMLELLEGARLAVCLQDDWTRAHQRIAASLLDAYAAAAPAIAEEIGGAELDDLLAAHRLWAEWLETGRVRKFAIVAERVSPPACRRSAAQGGEERH